MSGSADRVAVTAIVLAAGEGSRMKSQLPKVLHGFAGRSLIQHVLASLDGLGSEPDATTSPHPASIKPASINPASIKLASIKLATIKLVVVGHALDAVTAHLHQVAPSAMPIVQQQQLGTGDAVRVALRQLDLLPIGAVSHGGVVIVIPGDTPLLTPATLRTLVTEHLHSGAAATMLTSIAPDPTGYGRVLRDADGTVVRVVEHADATAAERQVHEVAAGVYAFDAELLRAALGELSNDNAQGELYLPDVVGIFTRQGRPVAAMLAAHDETAGVNTRSQLAAVHRIYNARLLENHMSNGVTVIDPATTWVDADVQIGSDTILRPSVELLGHTTVAAGAVIGPDVTLTDTTIGEGTRISRAVGLSAKVGADCEIGPFAYLRPGTVLADGVKIGTYVEVKGSQIGTASKVPHLSYVGDATIGEHTNIGAATVFVNYDGINKHHSVIGDHARTGADNMFVAPVAIGDGAYTAAGSVIVDDVPPGALGVARGQQRNVEGWVAIHRPGTAAAQAASQALRAAAVAADTPTDNEPDTDTN